jgi:multiple sugar transport system ATP-binding protein
MYVAAFIGSPRMNFIPVTIDGRKAHASGFSIELPQPVAIVQGVLGIRPEDFTSDLRSDFPQIELRVEVVEVLGSDQFLHGKVGNDDLTARVEPDIEVAPGDLLRLGVNSRRVHVFDPRTERTVF